MSNYAVARLDEIEPLDCPCGKTRRAFVSADNDVATLHLVEVSSDSRVHYHRKMTEMYLVLEGEGHVELDGERVAVEPLTAVLIRPGCRHRAEGRLRVVVCAVPAFDPEDEWFD